ncbi:MAG: hypothetical protein NT068_01835 [Candidatus Nomurabacteria bacterium]|nr:hypothetical protein [Candidatus Nomurabacteria bacterium]
MKNVQKQTELSLEQLLNFLKHPNSHTLPSCMLVNEVGAVCILGEDKDKQGENYLLSLLEDEDINHRAIAFCCLSTNKEISDRNKVALLKFRSEPKNKELMPSIDETLSEYI